LKEHPADARVTKQLENLKSASIGNGIAEAQETSEEIDDAAMVEAASRPKFPIGFLPTLMKKCRLWKPELIASWMTCYEKLESE